MKERLRARRVGGDDDPLDQRVRRLLHQFAVLEGARLGLVRVADEVLVHRALRQERDLLAHREARAAAAAQARGFELGEHLARAPSRAPCAARSSRRALRRPRACSARARRCPSNSSMSLIACRPPGRARNSRVGARVGTRRVASCFSGSTGRPARASSSSVGTSSCVERADVDAVDRRHRRDVARAEALERAHVEVGVLAGLLAASPRTARRRRAASTRCSCTRTRCACPPGWFSSMS